VSVAIGDLNGDGDLDIAVANSDSDNVSVLLGNGDGTFLTAVNYGAGAGPSSVAIGDLNGDIALDLAVANHLIDNVSILINTGLIQNPDNGHWYQRFDNIMTWHEAKAHCENIGGHLATITSQDENDFVYANLVIPTDDYWLGGTDEVVEGDWRWITGETWDYTNWALGQPDDAHGGQDYLLFWSMFPNSWDDAGCPGTCSYEFSFICEWDQPNYCKADFNDDGDVDGSDLSVFATDFGRTNCSDDCEGDFDNDNDVDGSDLAVFAADFGRTDCH
jgi:hypothetical protein